MTYLAPYLMFDGTAAEAMTFYHHTLGGKLDLLTNAVAPTAEHTPAGNENRIMHARLAFGEQSLMASDSLAGTPFEGMKGMRVSLILDSADEAKRVFDAFASGGNVEMPMAETFWSKAFGMVTDRFGTPWMVNGGMIPFNG